MAKGTKPGAKPEAQEEVAEVAPKKSKLKLIIISTLAVVLLAGGALLIWLWLTPSPPPEGGKAPGATGEQKAEEPKGPAKFVDLGSFTTNLAPDEGDRFVQVAISLKITRPELEEAITASKPEIMHRVNMLLQGKLPSEVATHEGKILLAEQIKVQIQQVLGLRKTAPPIGAEPTVGAPVDTKVKGGLDEVLFTSFLIQ